MEYLKTINDSLRTINEKNIKYMDLFDYPNFVYGNINYNSSKVDFCKYPLQWDVSCFLVKTLIFLSLCWRV